MSETNRSDDRDQRIGGGRLSVATSHSAPRSPDVDADVVLRARAGDDSAFAQLVEHYDPLLRRLVHHLLGDRERSDRVLQDAYVKAYRALPQFRRNSSPGPWLSRIVYHACLDDLRRQARRSGRPGTAKEQPDDGPDRPDLEHALHRLPPDQRAIVLLIDGEGLEHSAVADVLDLSPASMTSRLIKARTVLRAVLGNDQQVDDDPVDDERAEASTARVATRDGAQDPVGRPAVEGSTTAITDHRRRAEIVCRSGVDPGAEGEGNGAVPLDDRRRSMGAIDEVADVPIGGERAGS